MNGARILFCLLLFVVFPWELRSLLAAQDEQETPVFTQGEVIVTGQKTAAENIGSIEVIDEDDIKATGAKNVAEALRLAAGIRVDTAPTSISSNGKGEWLGSMRGFDPRNVVVLIDGVPVYEPYFRVLDLRQIPVGDIAKIKIIKGPTSVLYGPNALGGVINIITKKGAGKLRGHVDGSYGTGETFSGSGSVLGNHKGFEYFFSPGFSKSNGFILPEDFTKTRNEDGGLRKNSDYFDYYLSGKFGYGQGANGIALSANHYEFIGGVPFSMEDPAPSTLWRKLWRKTSVALHGELSPVDFFYVKGKVFYTRFYNTITTYEDVTISSVVDDGDAVSTYDNDVAGFILMPQFILGKGGAITLSSLYKYDEVSIQNEAGAKWFDFGAETFSEAAEYQLSVSGVDLQLGGAYNYYRRTQTPSSDLGDDNEAFDYQAGLAYTPHEMFTIRSAVAGKSSFPDLKTLYSSTGNPDLKPERALNVDTGFRLKPISQVALEAVGFYSDIQNLIGKKDDGNTYTFENIDSARIYGVESTLRLNFLEGFISIMANHAYTKTHDGRADRVLESLDFRPEHKVVADGRVSAPFGTNFALQYMYTGSRKYEVAGKDAKIRTLPEYGTFDARLWQTIRWNQNKTSCDLFVEVKNIGDVYYEVSPERPAPGRSIYGGAAFDF